MKYMKQAVLAVFVTAAFIVYALHQKSADSPLVTAPSSLGAASGSPATTAKYRDGTYTGDPANAFFGDIQVKAVISGGRITDVKFLQYPNDRRESININNQAMPYLKQEAIQAQSANVDIVTGATDSSQAFIQSLGSALSQAL